LVRQEIFRRTLAQATGRCSRILSTVPVRDDLFGYRPLSRRSFCLGGEETRGESTVAEARYDDSLGGVVDALVVSPRDAGAERLPGVILAHGGFEGGKLLFLEQAVELSSHGFLVLVADTTFPRSGDAEAVESAVRAGVVTHRRSVDVLEGAYGASSVGFFGHSKGGSEGAILSAIEPRLAAIAIGGVGSASAERREAAREDAGRAAYFDAIFSFDAAIYLSVPGRRRLLVQHGRGDTEMSLTEAQAMFQAAAEPKSWLDYECGHGVDGHAPARRDRITFFDRELRRKPRTAGR
jgi:hypothetical protein